MRLALLALVSLAFAAHTRAAEPIVLDLWDGTPPGVPPRTTAAEGPVDKPGEEKLVAGKKIIRLGNVSVPQLTVYRPEKPHPAGTAVVICPGGGFSILAYDLEGTEAAEWLNSLGITAAVLKYRVPTRDQEPPWGAPVQDAQRALSLLRSRAAEWSLDPAHVGILGFSAGGATAGWTALAEGRRSHEARDSADQQSCRPDFAALIYTGGFIDKETGQLRADVRPTAQTPPMFFVHAADDSGTPPTHSLLLAAALAKAGVPAETHVFASGGHGFGLRPVEGQPATAWPRLCEDWLRSRGFLGAAR